LLFEGRDYQFQLGKSTVIQQGDDVTIVACGIMVDVAIQASAALLKDNIKARVINLSSIKPIDEEVLVDAARQTGAIVTAEEHSVIGGLGSAVAEVLVKKAPVPMEMLGIEGVFGESGKPNELLEKHHLTVEGLISKVRSVIARKVI
jgi:transketolase